MVGVPELPEVEVVRRGLERWVVGRTVANVERGSLLFHIGGVDQVVGAGESLVIPPHVPHGVVALEDTVVTDVFTPRRDDWISGDDAYLRR